MSEAERFEVLILGSGEGGKKMAWHMARSGRRTAVVERKWIGGSCRNIACLPSKNEIWSARVAHLARHAAQFGTMISGPVTTDMARVRQRKRNMVEAGIARHIDLYQTTRAKGVMEVPISAQVPPPPVLGSDSTRLCLTRWRSSCPSTGSLGRTLRC
jgi:pyruvate/2-oxoglutarate dehydrogenase complex dihydrolipoamide dehydrogenase (E3) component